MLKTKEGFIKLLGQKITIFCLNYIYTGVLRGVDEICVLLEDPKIVYDTGAFDKPTWKNAQSLCVREFYVMTSSIESFGILKDD